MSEELETIASELMDIAFNDKQVQRSKKLQLRLVKLAERIRKVAKELKE